MSPLCQRDTTTHEDRIMNIYIGNFEYTTTGSVSKVEMDQQSFSQVPVYTFGVDGQ